jgi:predicted DNA-binding protein with PD1-like motif
MKTFRGGTAAELIPFRLDEGEDLVLTLARMAEELNLGAAALTMGSGALSVARLVTVGTFGPSPMSVIAEHQGAFAIVSMHGWILANQPEIHLTLSRGPELIAGRAVAGCFVRGGLEGLLLRLGNLRLGRVSDPQTGLWHLSTATVPQELPRLELHGQPIDPQAILKVPHNLLQRHHVLPIAVSGDTLIVATSAPGDVFAQEDLRQATGMRVQWVDTPRDALDAALDRVTDWLGNR